MVANLVSVMIISHSFGFIQIHITLGSLIIYLVVHISISLHIHLAVIQSQYGCCQGLTFPRSTAGHFALICCQWQWRCKQTDIIHHKVVTQVGRRKVVYRHARLSIVLIRLNWEHHLLPTRLFQQLAHKIHTHIFPWRVVIMPTLHIATEDRVTLAIPTRWSWVTEPCRAGQCLSRTNHSIRIDTSHQARFHRTIHIECLSAMRTLTCPIFFYTVCHSVLSIEWE